MNEAKNSTFAADLSAIVPTSLSRKIEALEAGKAALATLVDLEKTKRNLDIDMGYAQINDRAFKDALAVVRNWNTSVKEGVEALKLDPVVAHNWRMSYVVGTPKDRDIMIVAMTAEVKKGLTPLSQQQLSEAEEAYNKRSETLQTIQKINKEINANMALVYKVKGELNKALAVLGMNRAQLNKIK